jgi:hypothetical protein
MHNRTIDFRCSEGLAEFEGLAFFFSCDTI